MNLQSILQHPNNIIPTLFLYGRNDPVTGFGKGIKKVYTKYRATNAQTEIQSFPGTHDILHDIWKESVYKAIKEFLEKKVNGCKNLKVYLHQPLFEKKALEERQQRSLFRGF